MYCQNCGKEINSEETCCSGCGTPLQEIAQKNQPPLTARTSSIKQREFARACQRNEYLAMLMDYQVIFAPTKVAYDDASVCQRNIEYLERQNRKTAGMVWACIFACIGLFILYAALNGTSETDFSTSGSSTPQMHAIALAALVAPFIMPLIIGLFRRWNRPRKIRKYKARAEKRYRELYDNYQSVTPKPIIGFQYCNPYTLEALATIVASGKVDDIAEAMHVYDRELYMKTQVYLNQATLDACLQARNAAIAAAAFSGVRLIF